MNSTVKEQLINLNRITEKIMMKPEWYRYKRQHMTKKDWETFLIEKNNQLC